MRASKACGAGLSSRLYVPNGRGELFVAALGRSCSPFELQPFTRSWRLAPDQFRIVYRGHSYDETVIGSVGASVTAAGQVYMDSQLESDPDAWLLRLRVNRNIKAELCLTHATFFYPQLHELEVPFSLRDSDDLIIHAPPETLVTVSGIIRVPLGR